MEAGKGNKAINTNDSTDGEVVKTNGLAPVPEVLESAGICEADVRAYFDFIGDVGETFCGCWMDTRGKAPIPGHGVWFGGVDEVLKCGRDLESIGYVGAGFHCTLCECGSAGRKRKDIEAPRVLCLDLDSAWDSRGVGEGGRGDLREWLERWQVGLCVESSPKKYHMYWNCARSVSLADWSVVQAGLAHRFGGDGKMSQIIHLIRVPGFRRVTKAGVSWVPRIVWLSSEAGRRETRVRLGMKEIEYLWFGIVKEGQKAREEWLKRKMERRIQAATSAFEAQGKEAKGVKSVGGGESLDPSLVEAGGRNEALYEFGYAFYLQGNGHVTEESGLAALHGFNERFPEPLDDEEVEKTARGLWNKVCEKREKREAREKAREGEAKKSLKARGKGKEKEVQSKVKIFPYDYSAAPFSISRFSDEAIVERVKQRFHRHILRVGANVFAYSRDTKKWKNQHKPPALLAEYVSKCLVDTINDEEFRSVYGVDRRGNPDPFRLRAAVDQFQSSALKARLVADLQNGQSLEEMDLAGFDAYPHKLHCANGLLDMVSGDLSDVKPEDHQFFCNNIKWDASAVCPYWLSLMRSCFKCNDEPEAMVKFMQEVFGYTLSGYTTAQKIFIHWGMGSNGKSKTLEVLSMLAGGNSEYKANMPGDTLSKAKGSFGRDVEIVMAKSKGKRLLLLDDIDSKTEWNEMLVKAFVGKEASTRERYEDAIDSVIRAKTHLACNQMPKLQTENDAVKRRLYGIPYLNKFKGINPTEEEIDKKIEEEKSGILTWAVEGFKRLKANKFKFNAPAEVKNFIATEYAGRDHKPLEAILDKLFVRVMPLGNPTMEMVKNDEKNWHKSGVLLKMVKDRAEKEGCFDEVSPHWLAAKLRRKFKAVKRRPQEDGERKTFWYVKLKEMTKK